MQFDSWVCSILRGPILYAGHTPRIPFIRPCMPPAMHVCLCISHYMRQPPLSPTSLVARWTLNYAWNGTIRRIRKRLAGHINKHGAKTGSRRARRSAPAHLVVLTTRLIDNVYVSCVLLETFTTLNIDFSDYISFMELLSRRSVQTFSTQFGSTVAREELLPRI
jgi:hypothetical protein